MQVIDSAVRFMEYSLTQGTWRVRSAADMATEAVSQAAGRTERFLLCDN